MSDLTNDGSEEIDVVEIVTEEVTEDGTLVVDDLVAVVDGDGNVLATDETVLIADAEGDVVVDETIAVTNADGELEVVEEDVLVVEGDEG
jgi:hypothetical protein